MRPLVVLVVVVVLAIAALNLITVEVPDINPHEGAVAYATPKVTQSFASSGSAVGFHADINFPTFPVMGSPTLEVKPIKYMAPAPTRKSIWQTLMPASFFTPGPGSGDPVVGSGGTDTCTQSDQTSTELKITTEVRGTAVGPTGAQTTFKSPQVTTTVQRIITTYSCTVSGPKQAYLFTGGAVYDLGTYYFTNGWGSYGFTVEIWGGLEGDLPAQLSSTQLAVSASEAGSA